MRGDGDYFGRQAQTSHIYCDGGKRMLVMALLMDESGLTYDDGSVTVIHKTDHHLPLFVITFAPTLLAVLRSKVERLRCLP